MVTEVPHVTHTAFIQFVDASFRPRAVCYFKARPGAPAADLAAGGCVTRDTDAPDTPSTPTSSVLTTHLEAWPAFGYGTSVVEVGPATRQGGRLVGVAGVDVDPPAFVAWLRASPLARAVARAYIFPGGGAGAGGGPVTVRAGDVAGLLAGLAPPPPGAVVRVMGFPRALEAALLGGLPADTWPCLAPKGVTHVLVALDTRARSPSDDACAGAEAAAPGDPLPLWAALLPPDAVLACTAAERSRDTAVSPCRATAKLAEALAVAGIVPAGRGSGGGGGCEAGEGKRSEADRICSASGAAPPSPLPAAIDVGAAPGGWTQHLARCGAYGAVVAVEPGDLDPAVLALPGVTHVRARAEAAGDAIAAALGGRPAALLTCDANIPVQTLAAVLGPVARLLRPGAPAVITLKTFTASRVKDRATAEVGAALGGLGLRVVWSLWLFANTRCERTLICVRV